MVASQNGWIANDATKVSRRPVPGTEVGLTVRNGAAGDLLLEVAAQFDRIVQDIDNARGALDDWGYAERPIRGGVELSNHASGTAIDLNATRWPLGAQPSVNLSPAQIAEVRKIVDKTGGAVRWGGDYGTPARGGRAGARLDPMHFELADGSTEADCVRALAALRAPAPAPSRPTLREGATGDLVASLQSWLNRMYPAYSKIDLVPRRYGPATIVVVKEWQRRCGLVADGVFGPASWAKAAAQGFRG